MKYVFAELIWFFNACTKTGRKIFYFSVLGTCHRFTRLSKEIRALGPAGGGADGRVSSARVGVSADHEVLPGRGSEYRRCSTRRRVGRDGWCSGAPPCHSLCTCLARKPTLEPKFVAQSRRYKGTHKPYSSKDFCLTAAYGLVKTGNVERGMWFEPKPSCALVAAFVARKHNHLKDLAWLANFSTSKEAWRQAYDDRELSKEYVSTSTKVNRYSHVWPPPHLHMAVVDRDRGTPPPHLSFP